jgi:GNAT superfamily N-acetyltransferase
MTAYLLTLETEPTPADVTFLLERLYAYNVAHTGRDDGRWLAVFSRDEKGQIFAGLHGWTWAGWLKINYLWVSAEERGRGRGRQLLLMAEAEARKRGCSRAMLSTYSFQAPNFYLRLGYRAVATMEDLPEGHRQYTLVKDLRTMELGAV